MSPITVRRMRFAYPDPLDPVFIDGDPEFSFVVVALSLLLPYLEPYLIRTMRVAQAHVRDPDLQRDLRAFVLQEGQHYQQHKRFNDRLRDCGFDGLPALEAELAADYERFSATAPLSFNLGYAEGFEALTTNMATRFLEIDRSTWNPSVLALFEWHLVEEVEHRSVAFDVYEHVCGKYGNRVRVALYAQRHLATFLFRATKSMLAASPERIAALGGVRAHRWRLARLFWRFFGPIIPRVARSHLPWYTPRRIAIPATFEALAARYTERAERVDDGLPSSS